MDTNAIGKRIADLRKNHNWTQVELANKIHTTDKAVSRWESGIGAPELDNLCMLAKLFGVTVDFLLTGKVPKTNEDEKTKTLQEEMIKRANHDGILCIEEILQVKDCKIIETQLEKYPIHIAEHIARFIMGNNFDKAAEYCQKIGLEDLLCAIQSNNIIKIEDCISDIWCGNLYDNGKPKYDAQTIELITVNEKYLTKEYRRLIYHVDEIINATNDCRRKIIDNLIR